MADFIDCDNSAVPLEQILQSLFTKDAGGNIGIRVVLGTDAGTPAVDCDNSAVLTTDNLMRLSIESTPNGPALRLLQ